MPDTAQPQSSVRIQGTINRDLHAEIKRLLAEALIAGEDPKQMGDVVDEALREWAQAERMRLGPILEKKYRAARELHSKKGERRP